MGLLTPAPAMARRTLRTSRQSFNIAVDARPGNADLGRLEVEIGVAPSVPMRFLTLRLLQQGGRLSLAEEAA